MDNLTAGLVSVIIPVYNRNNYIAETIMSVLQQDYSDIELICVDDGSDDGSYETLIELSNSHQFKLLTHEGRVNKGQSAALNLGLKNASGEFICILDSDDLFLPSKVSLQVEYLIANKDVGLVYGLGEAIDANGKFLYNILSEDHLEPNDPNAVLLDCYFLLPQNSMVRTSVFREAGFFDESLRAAQDHDMLIRICELTTIHFIPEKFFQYRRHANSISTKGQIKRWSCGFEILKKAKNRYPYNRSTIRKRRAVLSFRLASAYINERKKLGNALVLLASAVLLDPIRSFNVVIGKEKVR